MSFVNLSYMRITHVLDYLTRVIKKFLDCVEWRFQLYESPIYSNRSFTRSKHMVIPYFPQFFLIAYY